MQITCNENLVEFFGIVNSTLLAASCIHKMFVSIVDEFLTTIYTIIFQNLLRSICGKGGALEQLTFRADLTSRDKDHVNNNAQPFNSCLGVKQIFYPSMF